jgi:hypothetical protein
LFCISWPGVAFGVELWAKAVPVDAASNAAAASTTVLLIITKPPGLLDGQERQRVLAGIEPSVTLRTLGETQ